jgi:hypothetical protein
MAGTSPAMTTFEAARILPLCPGRIAARRFSRRGAMQSQGCTNGTHQYDSSCRQYGPGSAKRHEECRIAPGTRDDLKRGTYGADFARLCPNSQNA